MPKEEFNKLYKRRMLLLEIIELESLMDKENNRGGNGKLRNMEVASERTMSRNKKLNWNEVYELLVNKGIQKEQILEASTRKRAFQPIRGKVNEEPYKFCEWLETQVNTGALKVTTVIGFLDELKKICPKPFKEINIFEEEKAGKLSDNLNEGSLMEQVNSKKTQELLAINEILDLIFRREYSLLTTKMEKFNTEHGENKSLAKIISELQSLDEKLVYVEKEKNKAVKEAVDQKEQELKTWFNKEIEEKVNKTLSDITEVIKGDGKQQTIETVALKRLTNEIQKFQEESNERGKIMNKLVTKLMEFKELLGSSDERVNELEKEIKRRNEGVVELNKRLEAKEKENQALRKQLQQKETEPQNTDPEILLIETLHKYTLVYDLNEKEQYKLEDAIRYAMEERIPPKK